MIIRYLLSALFVITIMAIQFCFSWFIALFVKADGHYPTLLKIFEPYDTLATGDQMFWDNEMKGITSNYRRALAWGMRNCGYGAMGYMGFKCDKVTDFISNGPEIDIGDFGYVLGSVTRTVRNNGTKYFDYKRAGRWSESYGWMIQFGWSLNFGAYHPGDIRRLCLDIRPRIKLE